VTTSSPTTSSPTRALLQILDVENIGGDVFRGRSPPGSTRRVYGGQAIAQALAAAQRTTPADRPVHSLHAYFLLAGDPREPIDYEVERIRDGRSFTTRRCLGRQGGRAIFSLEASFHAEEPGLEHAVAAPSAPDPEALPTSSALANRFRAFLPQDAVDRLAAPSAFDMRAVDPATLLPGSKRAMGDQKFWFRVTERLPDDDALHRALLAYFSDMTLLNAALALHGKSVFDTDMQVASLDHALWFHRPFRVDDWLLYAQESPVAHGARTLTRGQIFTRGGRLVASVAQEGLARTRTAEAT